MIMNKDIKYEVIDNFLSTNEFKRIQDEILNSDKFLWGFGNNKSNHDSQSNVHNFQFVHMVYQNSVPKSYFFDLCKPIESRLKVGQWIRIKVNLTTPTPEVYHYAFHKDVSYLNCKTAVLYINTNDGYTAFPNGEKVPSVENRLVVFDSNIWHAGSTCTNEKRRVVLNLNFIPLLDD